MAGAAVLLVVAEADGTLVATVIGAWDGWRGNIYRLAVLPAYRRRGIARAPVAEADRMLRQMGARRISARQADAPIRQDTLGTRRTG
jgi:ribosomal protein S18 acetylase RimI-like enzyme